MQYRQRQPYSQQHYQYNRPPYYHHQGYNQQNRFFPGAPLLGGFLGGLLGGGLASGGFGRPRPVYYQQYPMYQPYYYGFNPYNQYNPYNQFANSQTGFY